MKYGVSDGSIMKAKNELFRLDYRCEKNIYDYKNDIWSL